MSRWASTSYLGLAIKDLPSSPRFTAYDFLSRLQLVNLWSNLTHHVLMLSATKEKTSNTQILVTIIIELTTSALGVQVTY